MKLWDVIRDCLRMPAVLAIWAAVAVVNTVAAGWQWGLATAIICPAASVLVFWLEENYQKGEE